MIWCRTRLPMTSSFPLPYHSPLAPSVVGSYVALRFYATFRYVLHTLYYYAEACGSSSMWRCLPLLLFLLRGETLLSPASFFALLPLIVIAVVVVLFVVIISVLRELPSIHLSRPLFLIAPLLLVSVAFWYLTFIWNCHARCWLPAAPAPRLPCPSPTPSPLRLCWESFSCTAIMLIAAQFLWTRRCLLFA